MSELNEKSDNSSKSGDSNKEEEYDKEQIYEEDEPNSEDERNYLEEVNFKQNILKEKKKKPQELRTSFDANTVSYKKRYFGNYHHYSLLGQTFNHFGSDKDYINIERKPGQIIFLFFSNKLTDYNEYFAKQICKLKQECQKLFQDKVGVYQAINDVDNVFFDEDKEYLKNKYNIIFCAINSHNLNSESQEHIYIDENGVMVIHHCYNYINEASLETSKIIHTIEQILQHKKINNWISEKMTMDIHEKVKNFTKTHPFSQFGIKDLEIEEFYLEEDEYAPNNFLAKLSIAGRLLYNEKENFTKFKTVFENFFKNEIQNNYVQMDSYVRYQKRKYTFYNLEKCSRCNIKISESDPSYICYKCNQALKPKQYCVNCIKQQNSYKKFENYETIREEVEKYNSYINNLETDDSPCEKEHLLIFIPPFGYKFIDQMYYVISHFQTFSQYNRTDEEIFVQYGSACNYYCQENLFEEHPKYFCTICSAKICSSCMNKFLDEKYDYTKEEDPDELWDIKHSYTHPCTVVQSAFLKPTYEEFTDLSYNDLAY